MTDTRTALVIGAGIAGPSAAMALQEAGSGPPCTRPTTAPPTGSVLREGVADDRTPALDLLRRTEPADLLVIGPMEDVPTVPAWSKGRMVLIGDAAHAPSPSSGQGASLAVESAVQLARCVRDLPHRQAFAAYEQLRRARVEKIIATAARTNSDKAAGPIARVVRDLVMPTAMKRLAKPEKMAWQFDYRIDWDAPVAGTPDRARAPYSRHSPGAAGGVA